MRVPPTFSIRLAAAALALAASTAAADSMRARCGFAATAETPPDTTETCAFSQRQGFIGISLPDGQRLDFSPVGDTPGNFVDAQGRAVYRQRGLGKDGMLFQLPDRFLYVYWDAAPLKLECTAEELADCTLGDGGMLSFRLQASRGGSLNTLRIEPKGLTVVNEPQQVELDGSAYLAELADLDANGWPEVYVYVSSAGSGSYGSLAAWAVNRGRSMTPIYLPPMEATPDAMQGYMGHDEFRVVENRLVRRFPLYAAGDTNAAPSDGTRQLQYRLEAGEATWILQVDKVVDY